MSEQILEEEESRSTFPTYLKQKKGERGGASTSKFFVIRSIANTTVVLHCIYETSYGRVVHLSHSPNTNRTAKASTSQLLYDDEEIIGLAITTGSGIGRGNCYVVCGLYYGVQSQEVGATGTDLFETNQNTIKVVAKGYVHDTSPVQLGQNEDSLSGQGFIYDSQVTNPSAGADFTFGVRSNVRQKIRGISFQLTTSGAATRFITGVFQDGVPNNLGLAFKVQMAITVIAGTYNFLGSIGSTVGGAIPTTPTDSTTNPKVPLIFGEIFLDSLSNPGQFSTITDNIQAGDQYQNIFVTIEEWLEI